jgi:hypothetical protein
MPSKNTSVRPVAAPWREDSPSSSGSTPWASASFFPGNGEEVDEINEPLSPLEEFDAGCQALLARRAQEDVRAEQRLAAQTNFLWKQNDLLCREQVDLQYRLALLRYQLDLVDHQLSELQIAWWAVNWSAVDTLRAEKLRLELRLVLVETELDNYDLNHRQAVDASNRERDVLAGARAKEDALLEVEYARLLAESGGLAEIESDALLLLDPSLIATHVVTDEVLCHGFVPVPRLLWRDVVETMPDGSQVRVWSSVHPRKGVVAGVQHVGAEPSHTPNNELTGEGLEECVAGSDRRFTNGLDVAGLTAGLEALERQLRESGQGERVGSPEPTACPHCPADPDHERGPCGFPSLPALSQEPRASFRPDFSSLGQWVTEMKARKVAERERRQARRPVTPAETNDSEVVRIDSRYTAGFVSPAR